MIEDIVYQDIQFFEMEIDDAAITYPMVILFGNIDSTDIIQTERITII